MLTHGKYCFALKRVRAKLRFAWALGKVFASGSPHVLLQILNRYLIPIRIETSDQYGLPLTQQNIQLSGLIADDDTAH